MEGSDIRKECSCIYNLGSTYIETKTSFQKQDDLQVFYKPPNEDIISINLTQLLEDKVGEFYLNNDNKLISIPTCETLTEDPKILELRTSLEKKVERRLDDARVEEL